MMHELTATENKLQLALALAHNKLAYTMHAPGYVASGRARLVQARRWLRPVIDHLAHERRVCRVLELGPADGFLTGYLGDLGHSVTAVEFSPAMAAATRAHAPRARIVEAEFLDADLDEQFDVVLVSAFAHLFPPPADVAVLRRAADLLAPEGIGYLATTVHGIYSTGFEVKDHGATAMARYRTRYTREQFESVIAAAGLDIRRSYLTLDRYHPEKCWGNWIVSREQL